MYKGHAGLRHRQCAALLARGATPPPHQTNKTTTLLLPGLKKSFENPDPPLVGHNSRGPDLG